MTFFDQLRRISNLLRLAPFDTSSPEGESRERYRRILLTTGASFAARGVSMVAGLVTVPLTLNYLGTERYGIWMTISSLFAILGVVDFGIGNGLVNAVAEASGHHSKNQLKRSVSTAFGLLLGIALACAAMAWLAYLFLPVERLFNVKSAEAMQESRTALLIFAGVFCVTLPLSVVQRFHEGMQEGYVNQLCQMAGSLLSLGFVLAAISGRLGLQWLVLGFQGGMALAIAGNFIFQFALKRRWAAPAPGHVEGAAALRLLRTGLVFFALTLLTLVGFQSDALVIAHVLGPEAVAPYSVVQRLSQIAFLYWAFTGALWPAYTEAVARGDLAWVRKTIVRSLKLSLVCGAAIGLGLAVFGQSFIHWWIKREFDVPAGLLSGFGAFVFLNSLIGTLAVVMNSGILLRQQLLLLGLAVPGSVGLKILFCQWWGVSGPIWGTVLAFALLYLLPGLYMIRMKFWRHPVVPTA